MGEGRRWGEGNEKRRKEGSGGDTPPTPQENGAACPVSQGFMKHASRLPGGGPLTPTSPSLTWEACGRRLPSPSFSLEEKRPDLGVSLK